MEKSNAFSDKPSLSSREPCIESSGLCSGAMLKASLIAPRDIIDPLPDELLQWLHEEEGVATRLPTGISHTVHFDFESVIVDRLFPLRDSRPFIRRLHAHCSATATAADVLAELKQQSRKVAWVCGWLHDIGIAACLRHADEVVPIPDEGALEDLWPTIMRSSAHHGIRLASRWRLPSAVRHTIREHESFVTLQSPSVAVAISYVAERIAAMIGFGFRAHARAPSTDAAMNVLGLAEHEVLGAAARTERRMREASREPLLQSATATRG
ncbi:MAG TPA: HDOD domain-containing protein [Polyangiaceae bacterium]|nr:HDOD domain-containing protein [Polyangiaceae bacterium]